MVLIALAIAALSAGAAMAQSPSSAGRQTNQTAYALAMRCFIANGILVGDAREAGNEARATVQETKARESFDIAVRLGGALGYSGNRINQDFGLAQAQELSRMMNDNAYFQRVAADCRALNLM